MKKKVQKTLSRCCPECGKRLSLVTEEVTEKNIDYSVSTFIECSSCDYRELYRDHKKGREKFHKMSEE